MGSPLPSNRLLCENLLSYRLPENDRRRPTNRLLLINYIHVGTTLMFWYSGRIVKSLFISSLELQLLFNSNFRIGSNNSGIVYRSSGRTPKALVHDLVTRYLNFDSYCTLLPSFTLMYAGVPSTPATLFYFPSTLFYSLPFYSSPPNAYRGSSSLNLLKSSIFDCYRRQLQYYNKIIAKHEQ